MLINFDISIFYFGVCRVGCGTQNIAVITFIDTLGASYERKQKESKPVVAICYDFDKTLSPDDMQAQGYIQSLGYDIKDFWTRSNSLAEDNEMDQNLAYMYTMKEEAGGKIVLPKKH